jgi:20S proteasome alpha/beta subunit
MTIAIGFSTNTGVVVAADSQETIPGFIKGDVGKTRLTVMANHNALCFAGAGSSDYIRNAMDKATLNIDGITDFHKMENALEANLLAFFDHHIARWAYFSERERPSVELLIGLSMKAGPHALYHYSGTSFTRVSEKAIGAGVLIATGLIDQFYPVGPSVVQASNVAAYILSKVKKQVDGCGGFTDLVALRENGDWAITNSKDIEKLESNYAKIDKTLAEKLKAEVNTTNVDLSWHSEHRKSPKA